MFLLSLTLCIINVQRAEAVEPNSFLYSANAEERDTAYKMAEQLLNDKSTKVVDDKEKQTFLLQQQLLTKLKELPDKPEKMSIDIGFSELVTKKSLSWQEAEQYLERYINVLKEGKISAQNLENTKKQVQTLNSKLIALAENDSEQNTLQLQHAYQARKFAHQSEINKRLKNSLEIAKEKYPELLKRININPQMAAEQMETLRKIRVELQGLEEEKNLTAANDDVRMQQQESLLAGYIGQDLTNNEKKKMHYQQLKMLEQQAHQLSRGCRIFKGQVKLLEAEQKNIWYRLLSNDQKYFELTDLSGDIDKNVIRLREKIAQSQVRKYTYEKELSSLRGGNALIGPKSQGLVEKLNTRLSEIFTLLSGIDQRAEILENKGRLLGRAIDLQQSSIGSMVTKTREATDDIYEKVLQALKYPMVSYNGMSISLLLLLQIITLLVLGIIVNRLYGNVVIRMGRKRMWSERTIQLVHAVGKYPFLLIVAMIILSVVGINTRSLALVAGALSIGIGFGMQTMVSNLVSGIILLFDKSIRPGDFISLGDHTQSGGFRGNVVQMNIRATVLRTNDNINIIIPNADLIATQVVNWTYSDDKIRFRIPFSVAYGTSIDKVKLVVKKAVLDLSVVLPSPEPQVWMAEHADSSLAFIAAIWVEGQNARRPSRTFDIVLTAIYKSLHKHGIEIPFPQMDIRLRCKEHQSVELNGITETIRQKTYADATA